MNIREAVEPIAMETARLAREMAFREPFGPGTAIGLGECELSHAAKVYRAKQGTPILKVTWPAPHTPPQAGTRERPNREIPLLGTAESRDLAERTIASMEHQAAQGTEAAFRKILDDLLEAGVSPDVLYDEVNSAVVRSVMET